MGKIKNSILIVCLITIAAVSASDIKDMIMKQYEGKSAKELFKVWHTVYNKQYDYNTIEGINRFKAFKANLAEYKAHNEAGNTCYEQGINEYSDLSHQEFINHFNIKDMVDPQSKRGLLSLDDFDDEKQEEKVNGDHPWVKKAALDFSEHMMGVENQGSCGSCWSYMVLTPMEYRWNMKGKRLKEGLSNQQLVDCDTKNKGCSGGWPETSWNMYKTIHPAYESAYPYKAKQGSCQKIEGCGKVSPLKMASTAFRRSGRSSEAMYELLKGGPLAIAVAVDTPFRSYKSGILTKCSTNINHGVTVTGYGTDGGDKCGKGGMGYWIVQNSWGSGWGDKGFIKMADNASCSPNKYAWAPLVA